MIDKKKSAAAHRLIRITAVAAGLLLLLSGCGNGPAESTSAPPASASPTAAPTSAPPADTPEPTQEAGTPVFLYLGEDSTVAVPEKTSYATLACQGALLTEGSPAEAQLYAALLGENHDITDGSQARSADGLLTVERAYEYWMDAMTYRYVDGSLPSELLGPQDARRVVDAFIADVMDAPAFAHLSHGNTTEISSYSYFLPRKYDGLAVSHVYVSEGIYVSYDGRVSQAQLQYAHLTAQEQVSIPTAQEALLIANKALEQEHQEALLLVPDTQMPEPYAIRDMQLVYDCPYTDGDYDRTRLVPHWRIRYPATEIVDVGMLEGMEMEMEYLLMINCETLKIDFR